MSRKSSLKPRPLGYTITVTKKLAAISQLESAIWLWFHQDDPLSILALASNANECYDAMGAHRGHPSLYKTWLKAQSQAFQDRARYVYEFIRHGRKDLKGSTPYSPKQGEVLILDSVECHKALFYGITPTMNAFATRFQIENPGVVKAEFRAVFLKGRDVYKLHEIPRAEFLHKALKKPLKFPPGATSPGVEFL